MLLLSSVHCGHKHGIIIATFLFLSPTLHYYSYLSYVKGEICSWCESIWPLEEKENSAMWVQFSQKNYSIMIKTL